MPVSYSPELKILPTKNNNNAMPIRFSHSIYDNWPLQRDHSILIGFEKEHLDFDYFAHDKLFVCLFVLFLLFSVISWNSAIICKTIGIFQMVTKTRAIPTMAEMHIKTESPMSSIDFAFSDKNINDEIKKLQMNNKISRILQLSTKCRFAGIGKRPICLQIFW